MNVSASPDPPTTEAGDSGRDDIAVGANGHRNGDPPSHSVRPSPPATGSVTASKGGGSTAQKLENGVDGDGGESEAETLIDSPVKRREAEKPGHTVKPERAPKHRIGSLPVPTDNDDENDSAAVSPAPSTVISVEKTASREEIKEEDGDRGDGDGDKSEESDSLSSPRSPASRAQSRGSSVSRAVSELPGFSRHDRAQSPNPRKRKHRASSVSLPNKRPSLAGRKNRLRGLHSEELAGRSEQSPSPKLRSHRRAVSTQSALVDGGGEGTGRKRRAATQGLAKESKMSRTGWEESDASSETTSHGQVDYRRPQRGVGRSTSTPGRPPGREHKRHVNKYGFTKLAEACESGDLDMVKEWREKDPDQVELAEFAGNKPLQIAALNGNVEVVDYLIDQGCQIDCANVDKDTPLIDAAENGHLEVVHSLLRAGVDPLRNNLKGQQALDVVTDETDDADEIRAALRQAIDQWNSTGAKQKREEEQELRHRAGPAKELHFMARTYENLLKLVQINDRNGVREFLDARVPVDNVVIAAAAKTGDSYLVNMLLVELPEKKRCKQAERPLLSVLGTSHFEMVKSLTELDNFNALYRDRQGRTWPEIAKEKHGPNWRREKELLDRMYDQQAALMERRSSSPVTKRDSGKRRLLTRASDGDSDEDEAPRRKNGRKLMSKKELRAARGQAASDDSSAESSSEMGTGPEENSMRPPESPVARKSPSRIRTKSTSAHPSENSPRMRRRSSSLRGPSEAPLPTVEEAENTPADEELTNGTIQAREAQRLKMERKDEDERRKAEAESAAQKAAAQEEERKAEQRRAEAARRQQQEEEEAEEERKAEQRRVEAARRQQQEEEEEKERKAAEARHAQELLRRQQEAEEQVKRSQIARLLSLLPGQVAKIFNPQFGFNYEAQHASDYLLTWFTPLQVLKSDRPLADAPHDLWVLNVQVAPLLGESGMELMLRGEFPGFHNTRAASLSTQVVPEEEFALVESAVHEILHKSVDDDDTPVEQTGRTALTFAEELQRAARRASNVKAAKEKLRDSAMVLRYVRLDDVIQNLHASLQGRHIDVRFDHFALPTKASGDKDDSDFVDALGSSLALSPVPRSYVDGREVRVDDGSRAIGTSEVKVVHEN